MGWLSERVGRRPPLLLAPAAMSLGAIAFSFAAHPQVLIVVNFLLGATGAGLVPTVAGLVADQIPERRRGRWFGITQAFFSAGLVIGLPLGGVLYDQWGFAVTARFFAERRCSSLVSFRAYSGGGPRQTGARQPAGDERPNTA